MRDPQKIVLVGNFSPDRQESMQRFTHVLAEGFSARGCDVETWRPEPLFAKLITPYRYGGIPKYLGYLDKFVRFPREIRRRVAQLPAETVYHITDHGNAVYRPHFPADRLAVTCHDLLQIRSAMGEFARNPVSASGRRYQRWILDNLGRFRWVACNSAKTCDDLHRLTRVSHENTRTIHIALNYPYRPMPGAEAVKTLQAALSRQSITLPIEAATGRPRFLFSIGGAQWYKNRSGIVAIWAEAQRHLPSPLPLLYCGPALDVEQSELLKKHGVGSLFLRATGLSNEELRAAYSLAEGLLFPSWEEGFGWPIAEAQACGCPVFTSNRPPMTEVGGDAACYLDPGDPGSASAVMAAQLQDTRALRSAGLERAKKWDTAEMLSAYAELYRTMLTATPAA